MSLLKRLAWCLLGLIWMIFWIVVTIGASPIILLISTIGGVLSGIGEVFTGIISSVTEGISIAFHEEKSDD